MDWKLCYAKNSVAKNVENTDYEKYKKAISACGFDEFAV